MIVVDASVLVELVLRRAGHRAAAAWVFHDDAELHAPHLVDVEVASVLRRTTLAGHAEPEQAERALAHYRALPLLRHPVTKWLHRLLAYRDNLTAYDAAYVVLAEVLGAPLVTFDASLAAAPGHGAQVEVLSRER